MANEIKCPACSSDTYEVRAGYEGDSQFVVLCQDCGHDIMVNYAIRQVLMKERETCGNPIK